MPSCAGVGKPKADLPQLHAVNRPSSHLLDERSLKAPGTLPTLIVRLQSDGLERAVSDRQDVDLSLPILK